MWTAALLVCLLGAVVGAAQKDTGFVAVSVAYVVAAPLAAGLVRRGVALRWLLFRLPVAFLLALVVAAAADLREEQFPLTPKGIVETIGQQLVLHPGSLWLGTVLAVLVGLRRGLARRSAAG